MMKTDEPSFSSLEYSNTLNPSASELESKKVKLMYTSEFLKSFDRAPRAGSLLPLEDLEIDSKKIRSKDQLDKMKEKLELKDSQIQQLRSLVYNLKDLVLENSDESSFKKLQEILNSSEEGRLILNPEAPVKAGIQIPPLNIPESDFFDIPTQSGSLSPQLSPNKTPTKSPRRKAQDVLPSPTSSSPPSSVFNAPVAPSAGAPGFSPVTPKSVSLKSPRRLTKQPLAPPITPSPSAITASQSSSNLRSVMKRSPSMPVINNERKPDPNAQAQLKLQKKTKSTEDLGAIGGIDLVKSRSQKSLEEAPKKKSAESTSPRNRGIKKSVSMSSISSTDDKSDHSLATLKCTSLEEIVGQIYPLTKYQAGCRFLQKKLEEQPDPQHVTLVFNEVFEHLIELMTDPYGQYLVPKLMKYCDKTQRQAIVTKIAPKIVSFACHTYGIHGVQKILEFLTDDQVEVFVDVIRPSVILLAKDPKGNYLIQSFLKQFPSESNQFIFDSIFNNCVEVATHKVGCTLINRCIDYANEQQLNQMVGKVTGHCLDLVQDQFGNYVVQHLLATKVQFAPLIIKSLLGHIPELSTQKFSSNVIEKCLQVASADLFDDVLKEITEANLLELLQDRYANFVIQTALDVADEQQHAKLVKLILPYIHQIKTPYVMHIQKKILQV